jgi:Ca2+-binding EF-hand superfamily protein
MEKRRADLYQKVDSDSSGSIDQTEFSAFALQMAEMSGATVDAEALFTQYDADSDGSLSTEELDSFMKENAPPPPPPGGMGGPQGLMSALSETEDSDGSITESEWSAFAQNLSAESSESIAATESSESTAAEDIVAAYDTDGDGLLSSGELDSFMKENPPPFMAMPNAVSAYGANMSTDQLTSLIDSLSGQTSDSESSTAADLSTQLTSLTSQFVSQLMELISQRASSDADSSLLSVQA